MIEQFEIKNFRVFESFTIDQFGRVNLIVGKNNVGKTALMEAIQFYIRGADATSAIQYLYDKDEIVLFSVGSGDIEVTAANFASLFYQGNIGFEDEGEIVIRDPVNPDATLRIYVRNVVRRRVSDEDDTQVGEGDYELAIDEVNKRIDSTSEIALFITKNRKHDFVPLSDTFDRQGRFRRALLRRNILSSTHNIMTIASTPISQSEIARQWDSISLRESENRVLGLIRKIAPVERLSFIQKVPRSSDRIVLLKIEGVEHPVPLKSMGEGIARVIQIAITLESNNSRDQYIHMNPLFRIEEESGYLFIDELENGIHYSVLDDLWTFIFDVAETRNLQVFVTTHSWDCIESFQRVASTHPSIGKLISVRDKKGGKYGTTFDENELTFISKNDIEVR